MVLFDTVNILAFNRPDEFARVAASLAAQDFGQAALHVWIDGYNGSADEDRGKPDLTAAVAQLAEQLLPRAAIHRFEDNLGPARIYDVAENFALAQSGAPFVLFFEDDLVLGPHYLEALILLMEMARTRDDVAIVTAHGYAHEYLGEARRLRLTAGLTYVHSMWGFAVKRAHLIERKEFLDAYVAIVARDRYHRRDGRVIKQLFIDHGVGFVVGTGQDYAKHAALWLFDRCALTIPVRLASYIGVDGLHSNPVLFNQLGYGGGEIAPFEREGYAGLIARGFNAAEVLAVRMVELQAISIANLATMLQRQREQTPERR
jgi:hypothetical protein